MPSPLPDVALSAAELAAPSLAHARELIWHGILSPPDARAIQAAPELVRDQLARASALLARAGALGVRNLTMVSATRLL